MVQKTEKQGSLSLRPPVFSQTTISFWRNLGPRRLSFFLLAKSLTGEVTRPWPTSTSDVRCYLQTPRQWGRRNPVMCASPKGRLARRWKEYAGVVAWKVEPGLTSLESFHPALHSAPTCLSFYRYTQYSILLAAQAGTGQALGKCSASTKQADIEIRLTLQQRCGLGAHV